VKKTYFKTSNFTAGIRCQIMTKLDLLIHKVRYIFAPSNLSDTINTSAVMDPQTFWKNTLQTCL